MEQIKLSETASQRVYYFKQGCDKDGFAIANQAHLQMAFAYVRMAVEKDLGEGAEAYLDAEVRPYVAEIVSKFES